MNEKIEIVEIFLNEKRIGGCKFPPIFIRGMFNRCFDLKLKELTFYKPIEDAFSLRYKENIFVNCSIFEYNDIICNSYKTKFNDVLLKSTNYIIF